MPTKSDILRVLAFLNLSGRDIKIKPPNSIMGVATRSKARNADTANEDCVGVVENANGGLRAVLVADGLGSQSEAYCKLGAKWAIDGAIERISAAPSVARQELRDAFIAARDKVHANAASFCAQNGITVDRNQSFGTTLIAAVETETTFIVGYVGNGAIWHIKGNFNDFSPNRYFPWNALNYLNPHSVENNEGKEAVYRLISFSEDESEAIPTIIEFEKDLTYGDILMICTDGIHSADQGVVGRFKDGSTWTKNEPTMLWFISALNEYLSLPNTSSDESLQYALECYLSQLHSEKLLGDDASVGVIITSEALNYQSTRMHKSTGQG